MSGDYQSALAAAGAKVLDFKEFGSYQGEWYAVVEYEGKKGLVCGSYGSCSGCDAFESEFGWNQGRCEPHEYNGEAAKTCQECAKVEATYQTRLADFGRGYLDLVEPEKAIQEASKNLSWDDGAQEAVDWIKSVT